MGAYGYPDFQIVASELDSYSSDNAEIKQLARFKGSDDMVMPYPDAKPAGAVSIDKAVPVEVVSAPASAGRVGRQNHKCRYYHQSEQVRSAERRDETRSASPA
jgi:hypothetical protein